MKGYVQVYTGDGKGKTTAAIGLAIRALGAGWRVFFAQFLKAGGYSEHKALAQFSDHLTIKTYGRNVFIKGEPEEEDRRLAQEAYQEIAEIVASGRHRLVILDEANVAVHYGLITVDQILDLIDRRAEGVELLITGRYAHSRLIERADLVTEMRGVKHYFDRGIKARVGVEK
ncbi:MAG: cob(I)yrinic acid a,c-diamide adenosyltransferase [Deltaproteobacteria bacterium]|jgi:cob(I)alamin adenosyltransferase|nr:cob(I)yrinic acid a,c-diamide adenosyltransferase [Deltaproteobacteria bacterium]PNV86169.1 MAG: cob(I)yrinic acid a,c-diamide adenosyltransferase [Desulfobacteraceae bacterium]MDH3773486.1 cob(I)yrinic acid a,c-diamide adenosyltransferase [Deltaproteobacteria bacterium]MDH3801152.1 cob(I)yrinic acid a,c-diamide adenosyltransferase [Deltaproteobacteria bacterium]MDH3850420.1 cob(I)yrinic acid a,c-diamide adenosyltransferase [Deltaproteobacteria bacterium]